MEKREFMEKFVLNRELAGGINTDGKHWVLQAERAWEMINSIAPYQPTYTKA